MMSFNTRFIALATLAFASLGTAHLKLMRPVPYGIDTLNKSPLNNVAPGSSGSDFPCKLRNGVYDIAMMNNMTVGDPQELSFIGTVSHGGGTCQLAITKDQKPTADSVFKVFQVFEGGCPVNSNGNTGTHPFTFVLPKDMPNGVMTFAWIWYNRIGDREIYMNCAPVTVSGGSDNDDYFTSLPNAYIINLPTSECQSTFEEESNAVTIPHPGQFILKSFEGQQMHVATGPNCSAKAAAQLDGVVGYKSNIIETNGAKYEGLPGKLPQVPHGSSGAASAAAPATSSPAESSGSGGSKVPALGFGTASGSAAGGAGSGAASATAQASAQATTSSSSSSSAAASSAKGTSGAFSTLSVTGGAGISPSGGAVPTGTAASTGAVASSNAAASSSAAASGAACSSSGSAVTCSSDGKKFGVCSDGQMVWRAVAPGTTCKNGQITKRTEVRISRARRFG